MLRLLLDIHLTPKVAAEVRRIRPDCRIESLLSWHGGAYRTAADVEILEAAHRAGWTLVTYDLRTIPALLRVWALRSIPHGGVIFIDGKTMRPDDVGSQVRGLAVVWDRHQNDDWTNVVQYLRQDER